jgi:1-pyrroline-5-carboxylate dehydrogenase
MVFQNENTLQKFIVSKREELFHDEYERSVKKVRSEFGRRYPLLIGGKKLEANDTFIHQSPIDKRILIGYFPRSSAKDTENAVNAAKESFEKWRNYDYRKRIEICRLAGDILGRRKFEIAAWLSYENGKNRYEAIGDVDEAVDFIRFYSDIMEENQGFIVQTKSASSTETSRSVMKPYGVWAVIAPFNFPAAILIGMSVGALITGNTIVLKPASDAPVIGYKFAEVMEEAGLPDGVFNLVTGSGIDVGDALVSSEHVAGVVFTGSRKVGYSMMRRLSRTRPRVLIAELGGKNPAIVTKSADLDEAVQGISNAAFGYSGQKCSACSRVYVDKEAKPEFIKKLLEKTATLQVGNPLEANTLLGPLISERAYDNYQTYARIASRDGKLLIGGHTNKNGDLRYGFYVEPTIVEGLAEGHRLLRDELFVPILCVVEYDKLDDAIRLCNSSEYGLTAGIYSRKQGDIDKFIQNIEAGVVYINRALSATTGAMVGCQPFVGWKASGTTGKGTGGPYYLTQFLREQSQTFATGKAKDDSHDR